MLKHSLQTILLLALAVGAEATHALAQAPAEGAAAPAPAVSVERIPAEEAPEDRTGMNWQLSSKFMINHDDPVSSVPSEEDKNKAPMQFGYFLQDLASEATYKERDQNFAKAAQYWAAVAKAVPDVAVGYRRACRAFRTAADRENALTYCGLALTRGGVIIDDYVVHGELILSKQGPLLPSEVAELDAIVKNLRESPQGQPDAGVTGERLSCRLGAQLSDIARLQRCTVPLQKFSKDDANTIFYSWNLAMLQKDYGAARTWLEAMRKSAIAPEALRRAEEETKRASAWWRRPLQDWRYSASFGVLALLAFGGVFARRSRGKAPAALPPVSPGGPISAAS